MTGLAQDAVDGGERGDWMALVFEVVGDGFWAGIESLAGEFYSKFCDAISDGFAGAVGRCFGPFGAGLVGGFSIAVVAA